MNSPFRNFGATLEVVELTQLQPRVCYLCIGGAKSVQIARGREMLDATVLKAADKTIWVIIVERFRQFLRHMSSA
jgi:hypothetical protein